MNKKGFTLIEILAVVAILSLLIGLAVFSGIKIRNNSLEKVVNIKIGELESSAILYGQEHREELNLECEINNEKYKFCKKITVNELISSGYYESNETNKEGKKDLINNVTNESMLNDIVVMYQKNNRVYAKYLKKDIEVKFGYQNIEKACPDGGNLADCIEKLDESDNSYDTDVVSVDDVDDSIRYSGANPNNFLCFGSTSSTCPHANLYRIIGIFGSSAHGMDKRLIKVIKYDYENGFEGAGTKGAYYHYLDGEDYSKYRGIYTHFIDGYWYSSSMVNDWSRSNLNKDNLNNAFLNSLGTWANYIESVNWKISGGLPENIINTDIKTMYKNEIRNSTNVLENVKIGLIYVSDYAFALDKGLWDTQLDKYDSVTDFNWMFMGVKEWTITKSPRFNDRAYVIGGNGQVYEGLLGNYQAIRPSFYLKEDVKFVRGTGTKNNPFRII